MICTLCKRPVENQDQTTYITAQEKKENQKQSGISKGYGYRVHVRCFTKLPTKR